MLRSKKWLIGILAAILLICAALSLAFLPGPATEANAEPNSLAADFDDDYQLAESGDYKKAYVDGEYLVFTTDMQWSAVAENLVVTYYDESGSPSVIAYDSSGVNGYTFTGNTYVDNGTSVTVTVAYNGLQTTVDLGTLYDRAVVGITVSAGTQSRNIPSSYSGNVNDLASEIKSYFPDFSLTATYNNGEEEEHTSSLSSYFTFSGDLYIANDSNDNEKEIEVTYIGSDASQSVNAELSAAFNANVDASEILGGSFSGEIAADQYALQPVDLGGLYINIIYSSSLRSKRVEFANAPAGRYTVQYFTGEYDESEGEENNYGLTEQAGEYAACLTRDTTYIKVTYTESGQNFSSFIEIDKDVELQSMPQPVFDNTSGTYGDDDSLSKTMSGFVSDGMKITYTAVDAENSATSYGSTGLTINDNQDGTVSIVANAAGVYTITVELTDGNYQWATGNAEIGGTDNRFLTYTWRVNKAAAANVTVDIDDWTYGETASDPSASVSDDSTTTFEYYYYGTPNGGVETDREDATTTRPGAAGSYYVYATIISSRNYLSGSSEPAQFTISRATVTPPVIESKTYNGGTQTSGLSETDDYTVISDVGGTNADEYSVTLELKDSDNYKWSDQNDGVAQTTVKWQITARQLSMPGFVSGSQMYADRDLTFTIADYDANYKDQFGDAYGIVISGVTGTNGASATINGSTVTAKDVAVYTVTISLNNAGGVTNYAWAEGVTANEDGTVTLTFEIITGENSLEFTISGWTYGETANSPDVVDLEFGNPDDIKYTYFYKPFGSEDSWQNLGSNQEFNAGEYYVVGKIGATDNYGAAEYGGEDVTGFTVARRGVDRPEISGEYVYNGGEQTVELSDNSGTYYSVTENGTQTNAGTYQVTVTLNDNYKWSDETSTAAGINRTCTLEWTINAKELSAPVLGEPSSGSYTDQNITAAITNWAGFEDEEGDGVGIAVSVSGLVNDNAVATVPVFGNGTITVVNAGTYTVTVRLNNADDVTNYAWANGVDSDSDGVVILKFAIAQADNSVSVDLSALDGLTYGEEFNAENIEITAGFGGSKAEITYYYKAFYPEESSYVEVDSPKNAGDYYVVVNISGTSDYKGTDCGSAETTHFVIAKQLVDVPTLSGGTDSAHPGRYFQYQANTPQAPGVVVVELDGSLYERSINGGADSINRGNYWLTVTLKDFNNYEWSDSGLDTDDSGDLKDHIEEGVIHMWYRITAIRYSADVNIEGWVYGGYDSAQNSPELDLSNTGLSESDLADVQSAYAQATFIYLSVGEDGTLTEIDGRPAEAGSYVARITIAETGNCEQMTFTSDPFEIEEAELAVEYSVYGNGSSVAYNAQDNAAFTITSVTAKTDDGTTCGETSLDAGQYTVEYSTTGTDGWQTGIPEVRKADTYTYYFRITGVANHEDYSGSFTVTITQAEVEVIWNAPGTITYNGSDQLLDDENHDPVVTASVNLLGDDGQNISLAVSVQGGGEFKNANAEGEYYTLEASFGSNVSDDILGNYELTAYTNIYTIERLAVTIVAEGGTSVYGEDPNPQWDYADGSAPFVDDGISVSVGTDASDTADVGESYRTYITGIVPADDGALTQEELEELLKNYTINGTAGESFEGYTADDENSYGGAWIITARPISVAITTHDGYEYSGENQYVGVAADAAQGYAPLTGDYAPQFNVAYTFGGSASDEVIHAGSYNYSITVNSNYQIVSVTGTEGTLSDNTVTGSFDIAPHTITSGELNWDGTTFTYNGENQAPSESPLQLASFTGKGDDGTIRLVTTPDRDFINAGAYTFTATALVEGDYAASDYKLPKTLTHGYTMQHRTVEITIGSVGGDGSVEYGDELPAFSWNYSGNSTDDPDAQFVTTDGDPAEFYTLSANVATEVIDGVTYITGSQNDYAITATVVEDYADILANYSVDINNGTLSVSARRISVTINPVDSVYGDADDIAETLAALSATVSEDTPLYTGDTQGEVFSLSANIDTNTSVGNYPIVLTNKMEGCYVIIYEVSNRLYEVTPASIEVNVTPSDNLIYTGINQFSDAFDATANTADAEDDKTVTWQFSTDDRTYSDSVELKNADTYTVYYKVSDPDGNHNDASGSFTVTIGKATLNVTVTGSTTYGENAPSDANYEIGVGENELQGTDRVQSIGLVAGETFIINHEYSVGDDAGTYLLTITDNTDGEYLANYTITYTQGTEDGGEYSGSLLTVNQREITLQIADIDVDYGDEPGTLSLALTGGSFYNGHSESNFLGYLSVNSESDGTGSVITPSNELARGTYYIIGNDDNTGIAANYAITFIGETYDDYGLYQVAVTTISIVVTPPDPVYTGEEKPVVATTATPNVSFEYSYEKWDAETEAWIGLGENVVPTDVGTYRVTIESKNDNYSVNASQSVNTFYITPAKITNVSVSAYGGQYGTEYDGETHRVATEYSATTVNNQEITWTFSLDGTNYYGIDDENVLLKDVLRGEDGNYTYYTVHYRVTAPNHGDITGTFNVTIIPHTITIDWAEEDFTYNGTQQTVTATYDSFEADDIALEVSPVVDDSDFATFVNVGNYTFRVSFADGDGGSSNYELPLVATNSYTMKAAYVEVALQIPSQVYTGETFNTLVGEKGADYTVSGDMYSQGGTPDDLGIVITINGTAGATNVGSYDVTASWDNDNYSVTFADSTFNGAFVITAAGITQVSVSDKVFEYSGASRFDEAVADISASTVDGTDATWIYSLTDGSETGEGYNESLVLRNVLRDGDDAVIAYTVYYKITADNHADYYGQFEVTINPAEVSVVWCDDDFTYTGSDQSGSVTAYYVAAHDGNVEVTLDTALTNGGEFTDVNGGADYSFTATFAGDELDNNYSLASATADFHMQKAELVWDTEFTWADTGNESYAWIYGDADLMGNRTSPVAELANNGNFTITEGEEQYGITVEYFTDEDCLVPFGDEFSSATNAGVYYARVTVPATDNYGYGADLTEDLVVIYSFEVEQKAVSLAWSPNSEVFDGSLKTSTLNYQSFMQIGEPSGTGPDSSTVDFTFTNNAGEHTATMSATSVGTYGVTVTLDDENGANYKWSIYDNDDDESNDGIRSFFVSWSITSEENGWEVTLSITEWTYGEYDDGINYPEADAVYGEVEFYFTAAGASEPAEGNYNNLTHVIPQNAGTYWVVAVVEGTTDYGSLWATEQFTIHQATVEAPVMPAGGWNYTGDALSVTLGIDNGLDLSIMAISSMSDGLSASADGQSRTFSAVNAGSYDIGISLTNSNYTWAGDVTADENGVVFLTWTITGAVNSWTEELSIVGWTYGQAPSAPAAASMYGEVVFTYYQFVDGEYVAVEAPGYLTNAGTYYVTAKVDASADGNYGALAETGYYEFDILKADYSQSDIEAIIWSNTVVEYTGQPQSPIAVNLPAGLDGITLGYEVEERTDAGTYTLKVTFSTSSPNYNVPSDGTVEFEITAKVVEVDWCEDNFTYNGENQSGYVAATYTDINGDEQPLEISVSGGEFIYVNEDGYTFTAAMPEGVTNYVLPEDASAVFHILPAEVTVTIGNQSATYTGSDLSGELDDSMYDVTAGKVYNDDLEITLYITSGEAVAAGPYTIGGTSANANYSVTFIPGVFMVEGLGIEVEITPGGGTFGGEITEATAEVVGGTPDGVTLAITYTGRANDGTEYVNSESAPTQAGTYTVRVTVGGNTNYYISGIDVATMIIARAYVQLPDIDSKPYNGSAQTADIADNALYTFEQGDDWIDAGSYEIVFTLTDSNNYRWESASGDTATAIFQITRAEISVTAPVVPSSGQQYTYGDTVSPSGSTVLSGGQTVTFAQPYYVYSADPNSGYTAAVPTEVGVYYVRAAVAATDNYSGATSGYVMFEIVRAEVELPKLEYETSVYDGTEQTNLLSGYISSAMAIDIGSLTATTVESGLELRATVVGVYEITITLNDSHNYVWAGGEDTLTLTWEITQATENAVTVTVTGGGTVYGNALEVVVGAAFGEDAATLAWYADNNGERGELLTGQPTDAGTYWVVATIEDTENYVGGEGSAQFTITPAQVTAPVFSGEDVSYDGEAHTASVSGVNTSLMDIDSESTLVYSGGSWIITETDAAEYTITVSLLDTHNYVWADGEQIGTSNDIVFTWTISQGENEWTEELSIEGWTYGQTPGSPSAEAKFGEVEFTYYEYEGGVRGDEITPDRLTPAGSYLVVATVEGNSNFAGLETELEFVVEKADYDISGITWSNTAVKYTGQPQSPVAGNLPAGLDGIMLGYEVGSATNAGTYTLTVTFSNSSPNYNVPASTTVEFVISRLAVSADWCEDDFTYTGYDQSGSVTATYTDVFGNEHELEVTLTSADEFINVNASGYTFTATFMAGDAASVNYLLGNATAVFHIRAAQVRLNINPGGGTYGGVITPATATVVGAEGVAVSITYSGTANDGTVYSNSTAVPTQAGSYTVRATISDTNYTVVGGNTAVMVIERATVAVPDAGSKTYTGNPLTSDLASNSRYSVEQGDDWINVGEYEVTLTLTDPYNYRWENGDGTATAIFRITRAGNSVTPPEVEDVYAYGDEIVPTGSVALHGTVYYVFSADEDFSEYSLTAPTAVGVYYVRAMVDATANYEGCVSEGVRFEIVSAVVAVPELDFTSSVFDGSEQFNAISGADTAIMDITADCEIVTDGVMGLSATNAGTYTVTFTLKDGISYAFSTGEREVTLTWSISRMALEKPAADDSYFMENGDPLTYMPEGFDEELMNIVGNVQDAAGEYIVSVTLADPDNYVWADGTTDPVLFTFTVDVNYLWLIILLSVLLILAIIALVVLAVLLAKRRNNKSDDDPEGGTPANDGAYGFALLAASPLITSTAQIWICVGLGIALAVVIAIDIVLAVKLKKAAAFEGNAEAAAAGDAEGAEEGNAGVTAGDNAEGAEAGVEAAEEGSAEAAEESGNKGADSQ
ncbi:MAG TPA: hypothetical protein IAB90_01700 [Candidatus Coproplasma stercoripullorum]|uniref:MBG domain-containing protein n=1 Tax=Candidatus Coproplasma stercoripullorum TaxID=2840751 RepID=A0A9D1AEZ0_9FIRM|nr:hypothetical protein [Candidatus Coproplasma stercoripullorum]